MAKSVAEIRSRFMAQLKKLAETSENMKQSLHNAEQLSQHMLDKNGWSGDVFDLVGMNKPFNRQELEEDLIKAITSSEPGVVGDLQVSSMQGDYLAVQERAFRLRHQTNVRSDMHASARRYGHGHPAGLYYRGVLNYLEQILKHSKDAVA